MKTLRLETTAPFQGLAELVAYDEGLFEKEGIKIEWMDREKGVDKSAAAAHHQTTRTQPLRQPRQDDGAGQGRSLQRLRMGQLLARREHQGRQPAGRPSLDRDLRGAGRARRFAGADAAAIRQPADRRAVVLRHALPDLADAGRLRAARPDQARPRAERLALSLQDADGRHDRSDDADRAVYFARREEGLPASSSRRSTTAPRSPPTASMPKPTAPSTARCARRCAASTPTSAPTCTISSTTTRRSDPEIAKLTIDDLRESRLYRRRSGADPGRRNAAHL